MRARRLLTLLTALLAPLAAHAQPAEWTARPIRFVVPFAAGGNTDIVARLAARWLLDHRGAQVVIDNRGGAGGILGADLVAHAPPDGTTFCVCSIGAITIAPATEHLPYDPLRDLAPISLINTNPLVLLVNLAVPAHSVAELVALARATPGGLNYGSSGVGGLTHFSAVIFARRTGITLNHIPYRGGAPSTTALLAGEVQLSFANMSDAVAQLRGNAVRALAITTASRSPSLPDIPTLAESGLPGYATESWNALFAPAGTAPAILDRFATALAEMARDPAIRAAMADLGSIAVANTPAEFAAQLTAETAQWASLVGPTPAPPTPAAPVAQR